MKMCNFLLGALMALLIIVFSCVPFESLEQLWDSHPTAFNIGEEVYFKTVHGYPHRKNEYTVTILKGIVISSDKVKTVIFTKEKALGFIKTDQVYNDEYAVKNSFGLFDKKDK